MSIFGILTVQNSDISRRNEPNSELFWMGYPQNIPAVLILFQKHFYLPQTENDYQQNCLKPTAENSPF